MVLEIMEESEVGRGSRTYTGHCTGESFICRKGIHSTEQKEIN